MSVEHVDAVRGKSIVKMPAAQLLARAAAAARVVVDLGAGDGRFAYRLARAHPEWLCIAVDACAAGMRRLSWRAARKATRGGAPNAVFVHAAVESLPSALSGIADEVTVHYPWGTLLRAIVEPEPEALRRIVEVGRPGAALRIRLNASALASAGAGEAGLARLLPRLRRGFAAAGVTLGSCAWLVTEGETSWGARLLGGQPGSVLALDGTTVAFGADRFTTMTTPSVTPLPASVAVAGDRRRP